MPFSDLIGEGAPQYGGRWNSVGSPMVYLASNSALALLEVRVHLDLPLDALPQDYVMLRVDLADVPVEIVTALPGDPHAFGDQWLREQRTPVLRVPSIIVPESDNLLLNPAHADAAGARIVGKERIDFDARLRSIPD